MVAGILALCLLTFFSLAFVLVSVSIDSIAQRVILFVLLGVIALDCVWLLYHYLYWRAAVKKMLDNIQTLYNLLMPGEHPNVAGHGSLSDLDSGIHYLEEGLNKALISSLALKQAEINELQSQINPHFLYNMLDSIRGQALSEGMVEIAEMTESLANYFRYCITNGDGIVPLSYELRNVENYWVIQQYRFGSKISMQIEIDTSEINPDEYEIPKLVLQPMVENAIVHGLEMKPEKGKITIRITRTDSKLIILVIDDGIGIGEQELHELRKQLKIKQHVIAEKGVTPSKGNGIALLNVNERIKLHYGDDYGLQISSSPFTGTEIEFVLPIRTPNHRN